MPVEPVTVTTHHDVTTFDPETHRGLAASQLGLDLDDIHCIACGPDTFERLSDAVYSQDGTLLKDAVVKYHRKTTWEERPRVVREEPKPVIAPVENHHQPVLPRGAKWHGVVDGKEGNYVSDGARLLPANSAEAVAVLEGTSTEVVGK